ncbi:MAG: hypothetical protein F9K29_18485 [Hyphomicrobiaceae bacterium]|nr:MAG: hypothetical protein F9K29_18485 [Hyphomicrobiaceae bacterium]
MSSIRMMSIAVAALAVCTPSAFAGGDAVTAAFERMLKPAPGPAKSMSSDDPVLASFQRMLTHQPSRLAPPIPAGIESDPLIAAVVLPLLRSGHVQVVGNRLLKEPQTN